MNNWVNTSFGNAGKFYPLLYLVPVPLLGVAIFFLSYSFSSELQQWERVVIIGFSIFFFIYFIKGIDAIKITRLAIKKIFITRNNITVNTFGGKEFKIGGLKKVVFGSDIFTKNHIQFMFPIDKKNIIIQTDVGEFYISGNISGIEELAQVLEELVLK